MNTICIIMLAFFCALGGYIIGIFRGWKTYEHPCPPEDLDAYYNAGYERGLRAAREEEFLDSLEEAFGPDEDDENIIDCGNY